MPRRRSFRRRGGFRRARSFIRRTVVSMGPIGRKVIDLTAGVTIPDRTTNPYDNALSVPLLTCIEGNNEETESDGTNIAEVQLHSKVVALRFNLTIRGTVADAVNCKWVLFKSQDNDYTAQQAIDNFHNSNDDATARELRSLTLAKGFLPMATTKQNQPLKIFVKRQTLRRLGTMRENDRIILALAIDSAPATNPVLFGFGTIYVRHN